MTSILVWNLAVATVLSLAAWLTSRSGRRPALAHALWLGSLLAFIAPPIVRVPLLPVDAAPQVTTAPGVVAGHAAMVDDLPRAALPSPLAYEPAPAPVTPTSPFPWVLAIALAGMAVVVGRAFRSIAAVRALLALSDAPSLTLVTRTEELARAVGLARTPRILVVDAPLSPMIWAWDGRARLVLPRPLIDTLAPAQLDALLTHELAHLARRDHWIRPLELAVLTLFWWWPGAWFARRHLRDAEEQCCDAWVLAQRPQSARDYADALVSTLALVSRARHTPTLATGVNTTEVMSRRLTMIMNSPAPRMLSRPARWALWSALLAALPLFPVQAQEAQRPPAEVEIVEEVLEPIEYRTGPQRAIVAPRRSVNTSTVPPILLVEVGDAEDPVRRGDVVRYRVAVTNIGKTTARDLQLICHLPDEAVYVSGRGSFSFKGDNRRTLYVTLDELEPSDAAQWQVRVAARKVTDASTLRATLEVPGLVELELEEGTRIIEAKAEGTMKRARRAEAEAELNAMKLEMNRLMEAIAVQRARLLRIQDDLDVPDEVEVIEDGDEVIEFEVSPLERLPSLGTLFELTTPEEEPIEAPVIREVPGIELECHPVIRDVPVIELEFRETEPVDEVAEEVELEEVEEIEEPVVIDFEEIEEEPVDVVEEIGKRRR